MTNRIGALLGIDIPLVQAPMAGCNGADMVVAACEAGALGSLPCAMLSPEQIRVALGVIRQRTPKPINLNFFCHRPPTPAPDAEMLWKRRLAAYYREFGLDAEGPPPPANRAPFAEVHAEIIEEFRPEVVSFHFGLPEPRLVARVKAIGAKVISSATTAAEARFLAANGCDAIIAQGAEAGGHRGIFLDERVSSQPGTFALVPQVVDAVDVPVIAAGGIADGRGVAAAFALGASGAQIGTAYLFTSEATIGAPHRAALARVSDDDTVLTTAFTGRPARGIVNRIIREVGATPAEAPPFPLAAGAVGPLKAAAEAKGLGDFSSMWSGQAAAVTRERYGAGLGTAELTRRIWDEARGLMGRGSSHAPLSEG